MSHETTPPSDNDAALRAADSVLRRLAEVSRTLPSNTDLGAIESAIGRSEHALRVQSITAALREEDASHITARIDLVIAALHELNVTTVYLLELAEKLRDDSHRLADIVERFDDNDL
jgi:hypothetical protein